MATILRVKRRLEDNPQDALVLMCKRKKTGEEEVSPSLFVFRGTVNSEETPYVTKLVPKVDTKIQSASHVNDIIQKIRKERKDNSADSRYEVVNCSRGLKDNNNEEGDDLFDLVDLKKACDMEKDVQYAYDLYTSAKQDFDVSMLDDLVCIENYETDLIFGSYRDNGQTGSGDEADDDDDSNDENNWRNEYPDSEPSSIDEEDIIRAMEKCDIEDELSSDAGEDKIYDEPSDLFNEDVRRYGEAYAQYKARVLSEDPATSKTLIHSTRIKEVEDTGYREDSDDGFYYGEEQDTDQFREQYASDCSEENSD